MASIQENWSSVTASAAAFLLFFFQAFAYNGVFLCRVLPNAGKGGFVVAFSAVFNTAWCLALLSFLRARAEDPGSVPLAWHRFVNSAADLLHVAPSRFEWQPGKATYCAHCGVPRPERAHHCRSCQRCVLRMDHHCPWLCNCVGYGNHKFFLLAVAYGMLAALIATVSSLPETITCFGLLVRMLSGPPTAHPEVGELGGNHSRERDGDRAHGGVRGDLATQDLVLFLAAAAINCLLVAWLSAMLAAHMELCAQNMTSIESYYTNMPNPFDQGSSVGNLSQVFGLPGLDWALPVYPLRPCTDGISFERTDERILHSPMRPLPVGNEGTRSHEATWKLRYRVGAREQREAAPSQASSWWMMAAAPCTSDQQPLMRDTSFSKESAMMTPRVPTTPGRSVVAL